MPHSDDYQDPMSATSFEGSVVILHRLNTIAIALTPAAALETAEKIAAAAREALAWAEPQRQECGETL